jgi:uncharacterized protein YkwD
MVNKVALGILAVIILTAMTVGGLVGLQLSDEDGSGEATPTPAPTPTPAAGTPAANGTGDGSSDGGAGMPTPTPTPEPTPTASASDFDATLIEAEVRAVINAEREERDMRPLALDEQVRAMARNHSGAMAEQGFITHAAGGFSTADRYEAFDLADRCRIPDNSNSGIREGRALETIDKKTVGRNYTFTSLNETADNRTVTISNETVAARAAVDIWFATEDQRRKLLLREASVAGVGAVVTDRGGIYLTVDLC